MYYLIYRTGNEYKAKVFNGDVKWDDIILSFKGVVIDLFKSDKLTIKDFYSYAQKYTDRI